FWENIYTNAAGKPGFGLGGGLGCAPNASNIPSTSFSATQSMYDQFSCDAGNETTALLFADLPQGFNNGDCAPTCANTGPWTFFDDQWSSLYSWRSIGNSAYNALQLNLKKAMSNGLQLDFGYTFSKSI